MKTCVKCKKEKGLDEFAKDKYNKDGLTFRCKKCRNQTYKIYYSDNPEKQKEKNNSQKQNRFNYYNSEAGIISSRKAHLKRMFNITLEDYEQLSVSQDHKCAICNEEEIYSRNKVLCVDHNHSTGKIRGLLCNRCNRAIGLLRDDEKLLLNALKYLKYVI